MGGKGVPRAAFGQRHEGWGAEGGAGGQRTHGQRSSCYTCYTHATLPDPAGVSHRLPHQQRTALQSGDAHATTVSVRPSKYARLVR